MQHARTLQPADEVAHYRIVGPLGAGGMGEVYLATDQELERRVALKVLPPDLVRSEDRVRRFVQEAKSASSLNHPNIITIYEIGQDRIRSGSGQPDSGPVQYISMELVTGKTLAAKIHEEKTDVRTLLGYLAQAAEGIAKAHAVGIVHRDLKPSNIMVSDDGFAKVLDFGLAKLTESRGQNGPDATILTGTTDHTHEGAVVGTVHYMSPEQVQGKPVDHRSDVFSFGCILYEAATRRRPFVAESNIETMHKIIHDKPAPIGDLNPQVPAELRRLVRRCLAKAPDQRLQSMKDVAIELREIADEYDSLSVSATSASTTMGAFKPAAKRRPAGLQIALGVAVLAALSLGIWGWRRTTRQPAPSPLETMRILTTTSRGDVRDAALSADGRYLAYIAGVEGRSTLRVRQVATGSDVEVLPDADAVLESPSFSPDGNYVFYLKRRPKDPSYRALMSIPSLGGQEQERAFDVDSRVAFSPDGQQVAFIRGFPQRLAAVLMVRELASGTERELATIKSPVGVSSPPSWSPDGRRIAFSLAQIAPELRTTIALVDVGTGKRDDYLVRNSAIIEGGIVWLPDGKGFVLTMSDLTLMARSQLFLLTYPGKQLRRMTNDFNRYTTVSLGAGEEAVASVRESRLGNIYAVQPNGGTPRALTSSTSPEQSPSFFIPTKEGIAYALLHENRLAAFTVAHAGGLPKQLQTGNGHVLQMQSAADIAVYVLKEMDRPTHVWRVGLDGAGARQLTDGAGESLLDLSPDGRSIVFTRPDSTHGVWVVSTDGGEPRLVSATALPIAAFSPDGAWLATGEYLTDASGMIRGRRCIAVPSAGGEPVDLGEVGNTVFDVEWGPDSKSMTYLDRADPVWNVYEIRSGAAPLQRTRFTGARVTDHSWSPDGRMLALVRRAENGDNVWVAGADGSEARQVTQFDGLDIFQLDWSMSGDVILLNAGTLSRDVVMIRSFR